MKEREATQDTSGWDGAPPAKLTPLDVQQKEFRVARFGAGYRMREVDEFLDHVTDALTALIAENERLTRTAGSRPEAAPAIAPVSDDGERAAVDAFLRTEKGFLRDLGALVQSHAEELKTMVRSARREATPPPDAAADDTDAADADPARPPADVEAAAPPGMTEAEGEDDEPVAEAAASSAAAEDDEGDRAAAPGSDPADHGEDADTGVVAEEPIRLEEPEPARSGRTDDERDGSLRELFWGEE
jgi:DivIVA domain-containing protein